MGILVIALSINPRPHYQARVDTAGDNQSPNGIRSIVLITSFYFQ